MPTRQRAGARGSGAAAAASSSGGVGEEKKKNGGAGGASSVARLTTSNAARPLRPQQPPPPSLALDTAALAAGLALVSIMFSLYAPEAYMDETFHVNQTYRYCQGKWKEWDPKITTPPGLYLFGFAWANVLRAFASLRRLSSSSSSTALPPLESFCTTRNLRFVNVLLASAGFVAAASVHTGLHFVTWRKREVKKGDDDNEEETRIVVDENEAAASSNYQLTLASAALVTLLPTHAFYSFLYYTDVGALCFFLFAWSAALRRNYLLSASSSVVAMAFRQTSAVWACFVLGDATLRELASVAAAAGRRSNEGEEGEQEEQQRGILREVTSVVVALFSRTRSSSSSSSSSSRSVLFTILPRLVPLFLPVLLTAVFIAWNGGTLALGDKENHTLSKHWAQLIYFAAFATLALFPAFGSKQDVAAGLLEIAPVRAVKKNSSSPSSSFRSSSRNQLALKPNTRGLRSAFALFCVSWLYAAHGTIEHPFLLSDNRHYSFYAWRLLKRLFGAVGSPGRLFATAVAGATSFGWLKRLLLLSSSSSSQKPFPRAWLVGFSAAVAASLVPSPLLEFRYFTPAVAVAALSASGSVGGGRRQRNRPPPSQGQLALALLLYLIVLAVVVHVFLTRAFEQDGELKRFMW